MFFSKSITLFPLNTLPWDSNPLGFIASGINFNRTTNKTEPKPLASLMNTKLYFHLPGDYLHMGIQLVTQISTSKRECFCLHSPKPISLEKKFLCISHICIGVKIVK